MPRYVKHYWWVVAILVVIGLLALQVHRVRNMEGRISKLHASLTETQTLALEVMRELGVGGLIHNYKNLMLSAGSSVYHEKTIASANRAREQLKQLESQAAEIGVEVELENTLAMINAYQDRTQWASKHFREGRNPVRLAEELRFDELYATDEVHDLFVRLSEEFIKQEEHLGRHSLLKTVLSLGATLVFGGVLLIVLLNQHHKRRHTKVTEAINEQLAKTNEGLVKANDSLQTFASVVSHDLKTPVRHISFFSDMVIDDYDDRQLVMEHARQIKSAAERMDGMIAGLLEFTRTGSTHPVLQPVELSIIVSEVVRDMQQDLEVAQAYVVTDVSGTVSADPVLLRQVFNNLLSNSLKYAHAERSPKIRIESTVNGGTVQIAVCDNGIGIDPGQATRIFEPWQRLHGTHSRFEGNGIGLALVKTVINAHQGVVELDTNYTEGTRIVFTLQSI